MAQTGDASHPSTIQIQIEASECALTERVLHTHMFLFPSHQFGKVRDRSDRTAEKKENHIFGSPKAWKHPSFPHPSRPGWACYTAGRRTDAPHHTSTVHQPTRTHLRHTHTHHHTLLGSRAQMHISQPIQPDLHGGHTTCHTRGP